MSISTSACTLMSSSGFSQASLGMRNRQVYVMALCWPLPEWIEVWGFLSWFNTSRTMPIDGDRVPARGIIKGDDILMMNLLVPNCLFLINVDKFCKRRPYEYLSGYGIPIFHDQQCFRLPRQYIYDQLRIYDEVNDVIIVIIRI